MERGEAAVAARTGLDAHPHGVARRGTDKLLFAREFELDGFPGLERRQRDDVLDQHSLLGAKAAAHAFAEDADFAGIEIKYGG